jgi:uncharacterized protein
MSASCVYEGTIHHRRHEPVQHELRYPIALLFLDFDELPEAFDGHPLWSARRPALGWFRRSDYLSPAAARDLAGTSGPVRLLTHARTYGHCFNPVSFYYCFDAADEHVRAVVAHVTNTQWGERHAYVLPVDSRGDHGSTSVLRGRFAKALHVSPLMDMRHTYDWRLSEPGERLSVHIESTDDDGTCTFDATLSLRRREITAGELRRAIVRHPALTMRLSARIYTHALRLRLRGADYHRHPGKRPPGQAASVGCPAGALAEARREPPA